MSLHSPPTDLHTAACRALTQALALPDGDDVAAPIRAGMRARAIADACEQLALPAVLIDRTGRVLHIGRLALPHLQDTVEVVERHLIGRTSAARRAVADAVGDALAGRAATSSRRSLTGLGYRDESPVQLLRGVIIVGRQDRAGKRRMADLRKRLAGGSEV